MSAPFIYEKFVTGRDFIGRKEDCQILSNLLTQGEHVSICETPKGGKKSVIHQTLFNLEIKGQRFTTARISLLNIREQDEFLIRYGTAILRAIATTPGEYENLISTMLSGTHFIFDQNNYSANDRVISTNWELDSNDIEAMFSLPFRIAKEKGIRLILIFEEFQNIELTGNGDQICHELYKIMANYYESGDRSCSMIFTGSMVNAMKGIFSSRRLFKRLVTRLELHPVDEKEIIEHVVRGFSMGGKIIESELLLGTCKLFHNNLWYINHFVSICNSLSRGYIVESTMMEALNALLSINEPRFKSMMNGLTNFQVSMLKAILDGVTKFSSSEIIQKYRLNSSANVKRLKDALMKKEIVTFNEKDEAEFEDPLFEYWVRKYYFEMEK